MKKLLLSLMCAVMVLPLASGLAGCKKGTAVDSSKTQLYIGNFDGGWGTDWLREFKVKFEEQYKDEHFEPGVKDPKTGELKRGVELIINATKGELSANLPTAQDNIVFTESVNYNDLTSKNHLLDITDIVKDTDLSQVSNGKDSRRIVEKLFPEDVEALPAFEKARSGQEKYYVIPHELSMVGITYDAKLFTDMALYFEGGENGMWNGGWTGKESEKAVGPSGVRGGYDAGLPASYEQFSSLMLRMYQRGIIPFTWGIDWYTDMLVLSSWAAYSGKDAGMLDFNFGKGVGEGKTFDYVSNKSAISGWNIPSSAIEKRTVTAQTGYLTAGSAGRYYGLELLRSILTNNKYFHSRAGATDHLTAQRTFIRSNLEKKEPIGMIIEGLWWYNESKDAFKNSVETYFEEAEDRDFRWMPMPWLGTGGVAALPEGESHRNTVINKNSGFVLINGNLDGEGQTRSKAKKSDIAKLAKLFVQWCYTDERLADLQMSTGAPKAVQYTIPEERVAQMNNFQRSVYRVYANSDVISPRSSHPIMLYKQSDFSSFGRFLDSKIKSDDYKRPYNIWYNYKGTDKTAAEYFKGIEDAASSRWANDYKEYWGD